LTDRKIKRRLAPMMSILSFALVAVCIMAAVFSGAVAATEAYFAGGVNSWSIVFGFLFLAGLVIAGAIKIMK
jgi:uncharacterized membrane protein (DUF485 family)